MKDENGDYVEPEDVIKAKQKYSVMSRGFSVELLRLRYAEMDKETFARSLKTIDCLQGGKPWQ